MRAYAIRSRRALLTVTSSPPETCSVASYEGEWRMALELLAAAEPNGTQPLTSFLGRDSPAAGAQELVVVTSSLDAGTVEALLERALGRRQTSLVYVEAPSFRPGGAPAVRDPALLRLQLGGVPIALIRQGDDLTARLSGLQRSAVAHG